MSDSLRDQLLQAGFKQTAKEPKKSKPQHSRNSKKKAASTKPKATRQQQAKKVDSKAIEDAAAAERKATKAKIKTLIESSEVKDFAGESVYRFTLQNRIRELHVTEEVRKQLVDGEFTVTRLNGTTRLVPSSIVEQIRELNPDWAIVSPNAESSEDNDGYEDFAVPDDIVW